MQGRPAVLVTTAFLWMLYGCGTPSTGVAPGAGCSEKPETCAAAQCPLAASPPAEAPAPEPQTPQLSEESLDAFAPRFVAAFSDGRYERYTLSVADVDRLFPANLAHIIQAGRTGWVSSLSSLADKLLRYKGHRKGPDYSFTRFPAAQAPNEQVSQATDIRIEITANGDPRTIVIGKMYGVGADWKILKAEVFE